MITMEGQLKKFTGRGRIAVYFVGIFLSLQSIAKAAPLAPAIEKPRGKEPVTLSFSQSNDITIPTFENYPEEGLIYVQDRKINDYVKGLSNKIIDVYNADEKKQAKIENRTAKELRKENCELRVYHDESFNAFIYERNGKVVFNVCIGLLRSGLNENEIVDVLGHELTHWSKGHTKGRRDRKYSKENEREADLGATKISILLGYDPKSGVALWARLGKEGGKAKVYEVFLSTHPHPYERESNKEWAIQWLKGGKHTITDKVVEKGISNEYLDSIDLISEIIKADKPNKDGKRYSELSPNEKFKELIKIYSDFDKEIYKVFKSGAIYKKAYRSLYNHLDLLIPDLKLDPKGIEEVFKALRKNDHIFKRYSNQQGETLHKMRHKLASKIQKRAYALNEYEIEKRFPENIWEGFEKYKEKSKKEAANKQESFSERETKETFLKKRVAYDLRFGDFVINPFFQLPSYQSELYRKYLPQMRTYEEIQLFNGLYKNATEYFNAESLELYLFSNLQVIESSEEKVKFLADLFRQKGEDYKKPPLLTKRTLPVIKKIIDECLSNLSFGNDKERDKSLRTINSVRNLYDKISQYRRTRLSSERKYLREIRDHINENIKKYYPQEIGVGDAGKLFVYSSAKEIYEQVLEQSGNNLEKFLEEIFKVPQLKSSDLRNINEDGFNFENSGIYMTELIDFINKKDLISKNSNFVNDLRVIIDYFVLWQKGFSTSNETKREGWEKIWKIANDHLDKLTSEERVNSFIELANYLKRIGPFHPGVPYRRIFVMYTFDYYKEAFYSEKIQRDFESQSTIQEKMEYIKDFFDHDLWAIRGQDVNDSSQMKVFVELIYRYLDNNGVTSAKEKEIVITKVFKAHPTQTDHRDISGAEDGIKNFLLTRNFLLEGSKALYLEHLRRKLEETKNLQDKVDILVIANKGLGSKEGYDRYENLDLLLITPKFFIDVLKTDVHSDFDLSLLMKAYHSITEGVTRGLIPDPLGLRLREGSPQLQALMMLQQAIYEKWQIFERNRSWKDDVRYSKEDLFYALLFSQGNSQRDSFYNFCSPFTDKLLEEEGLYEEIFREDKEKIRNLLIKRNTIYSNELQSRYLEDYIDIHLKGRFWLTCNFIRKVYPEPCEARDQILDKVTQKYRYAEWQLRQFDEKISTNDRPSEEQVTAKDAFLSAIHDLDAKERLELLLWLNDLKTNIRKGLYRKLQNYLDEDHISKETRFSPEDFKEFYKDPKMDAKSRRDITIAMFIGPESVLSHKETAEALKDVFLKWTKPHPEVKPFYEAYYDGLDPAAREIFIANVFPKLAALQNEPAEIAVLLINQMGVIGVKLAQILSMMEELIPKKYRDKFSKFKEDAESITKYEAIKLLREYFGEDYDKIFESIGERVKAASIKVVYKAKLKTGEEVVVKIQRANIRRKLEQEELPQLEAMEKRLEGREDLAEYLAMIRNMKKSIEDMLWQEIDFEQEVKNAKRLEANFEMMKGKKIIRLIMGKDGELKVSFPRIIEKVGEVNVLNEFVILETIVGEYSFEEAEKQKLLSKEDRIKFRKTIINKTLRTIFVDQFSDPDRHDGNFRLNINGLLELCYIDLGQGFEITDRQRENLEDFFRGLKDLDKKRIIDSWMLMVDEKFTDEQIVKFKKRVDALVSDKKNNKVKDPAGLFIEVYGASNLNKLAVESANNNIFKMLSFLIKYTEGESSEETAELKAYFRSRLKRAIIAGKTQTLFGRAAEAWKGVKRYFGLEKEKPIVEEKAEKKEVKRKFKVIKGGKGETPKPPTSRPPSGEGPKEVSPFDAYVPLVVGNTVTKAPIETVTDPVPRAGLQTNPAESVESAPRSYLQLVPQAKPSVPASSGDGESEDPGEEARKAKVDERFTEFVAINALKPVLDTVKLSEVNDIVEALLPEEKELYEGKTREQVAAELKTRLYKAVEEYRINKAKMGAGFAFGTFKFHLAIAVRDVLFGHGSLTDGLIKALNPIAHLDFAAFGVVTQVQHKTIDLVKPIGYPKTKWILKHGLSLAIAMEVMAIAREVIRHPNQISSILRNHMTGQNLLHVGVSASSFMVARPIVTPGIKLLRSMLLKANKIRRGVQGAQLVSGNGIAVAEAIVEEVAVFALAGVIDGLVIPPIDLALAEMNLKKEGLRAIEMLERKYKPESIEAELVKVHEQFAGRRNLVLSDYLVELSKYTQKRSAKVRAYNMGTALTLGWEMDAAIEFSRDLFDNFLNIKNPPTFKAMKLYEEAKKDCGNGAEEKRLREIRENAERLSNKLIEESQHVTAIEQVEGDASQGISMVIDQRLIENDWITKLDTWKEIVKTFELSKDDEKFILTASRFDVESVANALEWYKLNKMGYYDRYVLSSEYATECLEELGDLSPCVPPVNASHMDKYVEAAHIIDKGNKEITFMDLDFHLEQTELREQLIGAENKEYKWKKRILKQGQYLREIKAQVFTVSPKTLYESYEHELVYLDLLSRIAERHQYKDKIRTTIKQMQNQARMERSLHIENLRTGVE